MCVCACLFIQFDCWNSHFCRGTGVCVHACSSSLTVGTVISVEEQVCVCACLLIQFDFWLEVLVCVCVYFEFCKTGVYARLTVAGQL